MENQILTLGPAEPCKRCIATRGIIEELLKTEFKDKTVNYAHKNLTAPETIAKFGVLKGPVVVVNDVVVSEGDIPKKDFLAKRLKEHLK